MKYKKDDNFIYNSYNYNFFTLDNGIQIIYIKKFLGKLGIITTEEYAKVIEKRKIEALEKTSFSIIDDDLKDWNNDKDLLTRLLNM